MNTTGGINFNYANNSGGVAPTCNIELDNDYKYKGQILHIRDQITVIKGNETLLFDVIGIDYDDAGFDNLSTEIFLDEPLTRLGDTTDYIDYRTQKRYNIDGTSRDIILPEINTIKGMETLSVTTHIKPLKLEITGKIKIT